MKILVFYAHPATDGHCSHILGKVKEQLAERKVEYKLYDLYSLQYDPILRENEHYTAGRYEVSEENKKIQEEISRAKWLIFVYPVWWGSMPAVLKGFFDRILTSRYAFKYEGRIPHGLLRKQKALVIMTSGSPLWYLWLAGNRPRRIIKKDILGFCGIKAKVFQIGNCRKLTEKKKEKLERVVKRAMGRIF